MDIVAVPWFRRLYSALGEERAKSVLVNRARCDIALVGLNVIAKLLIDRAEWFGPTFVAASRNQEAISGAPRSGVRQRAMRETTSRYALAAVQQGF